MGRGKNTAFSVRQLVVYHRAKGKSLNELAKMFKMARSTVQSIVNRFDREDRLAFRKNTGRPRLLNEHDARTIVRKIKEKPKLSAPKVTADFNSTRSTPVSVDTIRRTLHREGYHGRVARRKPFISETNRRKRLLFAREHLNKPPEYWENVIFSDESKFNLFSSDGRVMVWRKPNTEFKKQHVKGTVKHGGGSTMVWGCISAKSVGELVFIEGILTAKRYLHLLKDNLRKSAEKMGISDTFHYYEDNDPKHASRLVKEWKLYNCPKVVNPPPQSPDLNPIENLWNQLDANVHNPPPSSIPELKRRLQTEWTKLDQEYLRKIILNMPERLQAVIDNNGNSTRY